MSKVLIITHSLDNECIDHVTRKLQDRNAEVIRFNTDLYPGEAALTSEYSEGTWKYFLNQDGVTHDITNLESIWYRRSRIGKNLKGKIDREYLPAVNGEARAQFNGFGLAQECFVMDPFWRIRSAEAKELQLKLATKIGLEIPDSLITNDERIARQFFDNTTANQHEVVTKMQSSFALTESGKEEVVFTNTLKEEDLDTLEDLVHCPMQFQTKIEKAVELRVTIVGTKIFCHQLDSQAHAEAAVDWRRQGEQLVDDWTPYDLPVEIQEKMLKMMDLLQINYGAADIIVTPDGRYVFLEINPAGEFFWLDRQENHAISEEIAKVLLNQAPRRFAPYAPWEAL